MRCKTKHLDCDNEGGIVWIHSLDDAQLFDHIECGHIYPCRDSFHWPPALGEEPEWFARECEALAVQVTMQYVDLHHMIDGYRRQVLDDYDALCVGRP